MKGKNIVATLILIAVVVLVYRRYGGKKQAPDMSHQYSSPSLEPES